MVDKSLLINTTERLKRISVTDPTVAYATVITPTQILVHGRAPGEVSLLIWDELERSRSFDLRVDVDVSACAEEEHRVFPEEQISVTPSRSAIVLSGHVTTEDVAKRAGELAAAYSKNVVNVLTFGPVGAQEVLLEVKFAEVDRTALTQLGANLFSTGAGNTIGTTTTGQYGGFCPPSISQTARTKSHHLQLLKASATSLICFLFRPDIHFGAVIEALQTKNLLQILAEPNLIAVNGKKASFLAGGQFPFPIVQPGAGIYRRYHLLQGVWREARVHSRDHAQRQHSPHGRAGSEHSRFRRCADHFWFHRPRLEHAQGGNRVRIAEMDKASSSPA